MLSREPARRCANTRNRQYGVRHLERMQRANRHRVNRQEARGPIGRSILNVLDRVLPKTTRGEMILDRALG